MPVNPSPEKIEELRQIIRKLAPFALDLVHAFQTRDPDKITEAAVQIFLGLDEAGVMD